MTQGIGKKIAGHYVVCGAVKTTTGTFSPIFEIHKGDTSSGKQVHAQRHPATAETFATEDEAHEAAGDMAAGWIKLNA
jgi:hypothetical protein